MDRLARITGGRHEIGGEEDPADALAILHGGNRGGLVVHCAVAVGSGHEVGGRYLLEIVRDDRIGIGWRDRKAAHDDCCQDNQRCLRKLLQPIQYATLHVFRPDRHVVLGRT